MTVETTLALEHSVGRRGATLVHRSTFRRRAVRLATAALLVVGLSGAAVAVSAAPASASTCYYINCAGTDPHSTGCDVSAYTDTISESSIWAPGSHSVQLRRGWTCSTAWARLQIDNYLPTCCNGIRVKLVAQSLTLGYYYTSYVYTKSVGAGLQGTWWTQQAPLTTRVQVCREFYDMNTGAGFGYSCAAWHYP
jgi:hypothetical protein